MTQYLLHFMVYTMAMVGIILLSFFVFKASFHISPSQKNDEYLAIERSLYIGPKKNLFVVKAGNEHFLLASDSQSTTFLTKLQDAPPKQVFKNNKAFENNALNDFLSNLVSKFRR